MPLTPKQCKELRSRTDNAYQLCSCTLLAAKAYCRENNIDFKKNENEINEIRKLTLCNTNP